MSLNFALSYLKNGWSIIPLAFKGKTPLIDWTEFESRKSTEAEVTAWWTKWPTANIGIVTGAISGLAVIDLDGQEGIEQAKAFNLPSTVTVKTGGGGLHLYYKHPGVPVKTCRKKLASKIDIRGDGGYAAAPYSTHESGSKYAWVGGFAAANAQLAPFPSNITDKLSDRGNVAGAYEEVKGQEPWVTELLKGVGEGEKHNAVVRLAGYFSSKGLPVDVAKAILLDWNTRNKPPAEPDGIIQRVEDVYRRYRPSGSGESRTDNRQGALGAVPTTVKLITPKRAFAGFKAELAQGAKTIQTGFSSLDQRSKGLLVGNISVIGAWPGVGKTAFTLGLARQLAEAGNSVLYFPTEMAVNELMRVFISSGLSVPFSRVMDGRLSEDEHKRASEYLEGHLLEKLHIAPLNTPSLEDIAAAMEQTKPQVVMLDYLQHTKGRFSNSRTDITELVMGIKELAKKYESAAVVTSQFHRPYKSDDGKPIPPTLFDFAECGQIEREVSMALLMYPDDKERYSDQMSFPVNFNLAKNRFGKVGEFQLTFNQEYVRFEQ